MKESDRILEEMRKGTHIDDILRRHKGKSSYFRALEMYLPEALQQVRDLQSQLASLQSYKKEVTLLDQQKKQLQEANDGLRKEKEQLMKWIQEERSRLDSLNTNLHDLEKRGIIESFVTKIHSRVNIWY